MISLALEHILNIGVIYTRIETLVVIDRKFDLFQQIKTFLLMQRFLGCLHICTKTLGHMVLFFSDKLMKLRIKFNVLELYPITLVRGSAEVRLFRAFKHIFSNQNFVLEIGVFCFNIVL